MGHFSITVKFKQFGDIFASARRRRTMISVTLKCAAMSAMDLPSAAMIEKALYWWTGCMSSRKTFSDRLISVAFGPRGICIRPGASRLSQLPDWACPASVVGASCTRALITSDNAHHGVRMCSIPKPDPDYGA